MAQKLKANNESQPIANIGALHDTIRNTFRELYHTESEMERLKALHIKPLQEERTKTWRRLKSDTSIEQTDLKLFYKIYKRHMQSHELEEGDGDRIRDNLRTTFKRAPGRRSTRLVGGG